MNKADLIARIVDSTSQSKGVISQTIDAALATITEALAQGEEINLRGFGVFTVVERPAKVGRNPQTGGHIQILASRAPKFRAGSALKLAVNGVVETPDVVKALPPLPLFER